MYLPPVDLFGDPFLFVVLAQQLQAAVCFVDYDGGPRRSQRIQFDIPKELAVSVDDCTPTAEVVTLDDNSDPGLRTDFVSRSCVLLLVEIQKFDGSQQGRLAVFSASEVRSVRWWV